MANSIIESIRAYSNEYLPTVAAIDKAYKYLWQPSLMLLVPQLTTNVVVPSCTAGRLPIMGWSSWGVGHGPDSAYKVCSMADALTSTGLQKAGYIYLNMDDGWQEKQRHNVTNSLVPRDGFKYGMKNLSDHVHHQGFKLGIYSTGTYKTCGGNPGSLCNEDLDAKTFVEWGIDLLKYDNCYIPTKEDEKVDTCSNPTTRVDWKDEYYYCIPDRYKGHVKNGTCLNNSRTAPTSYDWSKSRTADRYNRMRDALAKQNSMRDETAQQKIIFSMCIWGMADVYTWGKDTGISWRVSKDMLPFWSRLTDIVNIMSFRTHSTGFCGHNDADVIQIGHTVKNQTLSEAEERTHFAMWAGMKSPLVLDTNITALNTRQLELLTNKYLIAFNQDDQYGGSAAPYKWGLNKDYTFDRNHPAEYWAGPSKKGTLVLMMNTGNETETKKAVWTEIASSLKQSPGLSKTNKYKYVNVFNETDTGCKHESYTAKVEKHDTAAILIYDTC